MTAGHPDAPVAAALDRAFRNERTAVLATLIRQVQDVGLAEDAVSDAFAAAVEQWPRDGVPANAGAWLMVTARRRAIDRLRRDRSLRSRTEQLGTLLLADKAGVDLEEPPLLEDDRLRLIFTCCHPALGTDAQVALTLRLLGGLTTGEVAHAFLVPEATMGKRIVRAKRKIADARIPYEVPDREDLPARLAGVLRVIYLIFNEGYAASTGQQLVRHDLCGEAVRLGRLLYQLMPDQPEVAGLLSLLLLHDARRSARVDSDGRFVALADQDRTRWDPAVLAEGLRLLARAWRHRNPGPYQLQAAIMAVHLRGSGPQSVDWVQIAEMYDALLRLHPSPVIELNRAVAVGFADGPHAGLRLLEPLLSDHTLASYQPLHASHAELLRRAGNSRAARGAYDRAIALSSNAVERTELERRREALPDG